MSEGAELANCRPVDLKFLECKRLIMSRAHAMSTKVTELLPHLYRLLIEDISKQKIRGRPGRSYPRKNDRKSRNKGQGRYRPPAQLLEEERRAI